jgi:hypothetical protein
MGFFTSLELIPQIRCLLIIFEGVIALCCVILARNCQNYLNLHELQNIFLTSHIIFFICKSGTKFVMLHKHSLCRHLCEMAAASGRKKRP